MKHDSRDPDDPHRLVTLLAVLAVFLVFFPQLEQTSFGPNLMRLGMTIVYIAALRANRERRAVYRVGLALVVLGLPVIWLEPFIKSLPLLAFDMLVGAVLLGMTAWLILVRIFTRHKESYHSIAGVISVYLLLGFVWARLYCMVECFNPAAFQVGHRQTIVPFEGGPELTAMSQFVYFSFVTMSTLGYGDITPVSPEARTLTWLESVLGQFYLAIVVAWLIGFLPKKTHPDDSP